MSASLAATAEEEERRPSPSPSPALTHSSTPTPSTNPLTSSPTLHILLDAGYGIPRETRPRQEKIYAISKQISNFLTWQLEESSRKQHPNNLQISPVTVFGFGKDNTMKNEIMKRLKILLKETVTATTTTSKNTTVNEENNDEGCCKDDSNDEENNDGLPRHLSFSNDDDNEEEHTKMLLNDAIYLSPDAPTALNPCGSPPTKVIVGLLIDRRVQLNRSLQRSEKLNLEAKHWPLLDTLILRSSNDEANQHEQQQMRFHKNEPLNVDTILEALQQWDWNCKISKSKGGEVVLDGDDTPFINASLQAFRHHTERHPSRPIHR